MVPDAFRLDGRTALVTGALGHVGEALCLVLSRLGATVIGTDLGSPTGSPWELGASQNAPARHHYVSMDLSCSDSVTAGVEAISELASGLEILVNNAAMVRVADEDGPIPGLVGETDEAFRRALDVNLVAPFSLTRRLLPLLKQSGRASIINVASIHGLLGPVPTLYEGTEMTSHAAYAASKGGLVQLTRYLSTMLAPEVRVNAVAPGGIARNQDPAFVKRYVERTPMRRMGQEGDLEGCVAWLAGEASAYVTGQVIAVDGGWTAW